MFEQWHDPPGVRIVVCRDEPVEVMTGDLWPVGTGNSMSLAPLPVRTHGLRLDYISAGRLVAWVRRTSGAWLAVVEIEGRSADGKNTVPMTLWCPRHAVRPVR